MWKNVTSMPVFVANLPLKNFNISYNVLMPLDNCGTTNFSNFSPTSVIYTRQIPFLKQFLFKA
jgi:hypothetical protein